MEKQAEQYLSPEITQGLSRRKVILRVVGAILSFYVIAIIISAFVAEESFKTQAILLILPTIATIIYCYRAVMKENYLAVKTVFILLLVLEFLKLAEKIIYRI